MTKMHWWADQGQIQPTHSPEELNNKRDGDAFRANKK